MEKMLSSKFAAILAPIANLLERKNNNYGNSYDKLRTQYGDITFLVRLGDKINRLESLLLRKQTDSVGESVEDTITDIIGYCTLELNYRRLLPDAKEVKNHECVYNVKTKICKYCNKLDPEYKDVASLEKTNHSKIELIQEEIQQLESSLSKRKEELMYFKAENRFLEE